MRGRRDVVVAAACVALMAMAGTAAAQRTGSVPVSDWSGASGHPQMAAEAIRAAAANFDRCIDGLRPQAARRGVSRAAYEAATAGLTPDLKIMDFMDAQPEFTKSFWDYLDILVSDARIARGREMLVQHRALLDAAERQYGVDRHVLAAIWGVETNYGTISGERPVLRSTATLACVGRRQKYFRDEFLMAVEIVADGDVRPDRLRGSWAGAFGPTQFMPSAFKRHAIDFDGDGRRDIVDSVADMIGSTANMMKRNGWESRETWGYEVAVPADFNFLHADRTHQFTLHDWQRRGVVRAGGQAFPRPDDRAYLLAPAGIQGPGFLMLQNFRVIMKYNPSEAYALAIGHLSDRLRGGEAFVQPWPRYERVLSRQERLELQQLLARHGFDVGEPDGQLGGRTRAALRSFQASRGHVADGFASAAVLEQLRGR